MSDRRRAAWGIGVALAVVLGAGPARAGADVAAPPAKAADPAKPITDAEALAFGRTLADAINALDGNALDDAYDLEALIDTAMSGVDAPAQAREGFRRGFLAGATREGNPLLREFRPLVEAGARIKALHAVRRGDARTVLLRLVQPSGAAVYTLFVLDRRPDGRPFARDYFSVAAGELGSEAIRRLYLATVTGANRGLVARLVGRDQTVAAHLGDLQRMTAALRAGRPDEVIALYDGLPEAVRRERVFGLMRYRAAQQSGDEALYLRAIQDLARDHPDDLSTDFLLIDGYLLQRRPEKALQCLDRVAKALGGDAYLDVMRGNLLRELGRKDEARAMHRRARAAEPDLVATHEALLAAALADRRFDEVAAALDGIEADLKAPLNDLTKLPEYADFLASPEGKAWAERRAAPAEPDPDVATPPPTGPPA